VFDFIAVDDANDNSRSVTSHTVGVFFIGDNFALATVSNSIVGSFNLAVSAFCYAIIVLNRFRRTQLAFATHRCVDCTIQERVVGHVVLGSIIFCSC